jgi:hypothetical protein
MGLDKNALSINIAENVTDKIIKRTEARMKIKDIIVNHATPFSV